MNNQTTEPVIDYWAQHYVNEWPEMLDDENEKSA
jgi:hypothetical protein